ncbi:uncharacterized protein FIESC28_05879 [Fusarium coffeatum]|uniref:Zn(2)-C6 fungal-type domain-containing protein n=1 Tax=Fusarium coffeatum TaxID=231269 RepID=A0A366RQD4_9HYPO|nr:uncharacterized protein FIESC28_05879 [Fusarium coffeatum]RBR18738.1 hypothetical protein FIESC28_05879 [Fusarium coffeatum]
MCPKSNIGTQEQRYETKLRRSCDVCSAAKIKCTQEKPSCAYCAKKSKSCVYRTSKRVRNIISNEERRKSRKERRSAVKAGASAESSDHLPTPADSVITPSTAVPTETSESHEQQWSEWFPSSRIPKTADYLLDLPALLEWDPALGPISGHDGAASDLIKNDQGLSSHKDRAGEDSTLHSWGNNSIDISAFDPGTEVEWMSCDTGFSLPESQVEASVTSVASHAITPAPCHHSLGSPRVINTIPTGSCNCTIRVLKFLTTLSVDPSDIWTASCSYLEYSRLRDTYDEMERSLEELGGIFHCSCSTDSNFILLSSLLISRIQAWYVAAINATVINATGDTETYRSMLPPTLTDIECQSDNGKRLMIQHFLSKFTALQILISQLSEQLRNHDSSKSTGKQATSDDRIDINPLPVSPVGGLLNGLHEQVLGVSRKLVKRLQRM